MSISQSLKERLGPRVQIQAVDQVQSGSAERLLLKRAGAAMPNIPKAALSLAKRHMSLRKAGMALGRLDACDAIVIEVPVVEDRAALIGELADAGIHAVLHQPPRRIDVKALRERDGMSQEEFALWYGLDVSTVRNWEQGRSDPDSASRALLWMIKTNPAAVRMALDQEMAAGE
jgi:DNA-binding transcriptional regulator YiaG